MASSSSMGRPAELVNWNGGITIYLVDRSIILLHEDFIIYL